MQRWPLLAAYYRQCLLLEQMRRLTVRQGHDCVLLKGLDDRIITTGGRDMMIADPSLVRSVRQFLATKGNDDTRSLYYAFPVVAQTEEFIPICYTEITLAPGPQPGSIRVQRVGELLVNRRFLTEDVDLTEAEVSHFARQVGKDTFRRDLAELVGPATLLLHGIIFRADPDTVTRNLVRELEWLAKQSVLSAPLNVFISEKPLQLGSKSDWGVTVIPSNSAQNQVLRKRSSVLQVVAGPPGTGKTQTIVNLIASAVADGETVLFISKNNKAVDHVYDKFLELGLFEGILRLGSQEVRRRSLDHFRHVVNLLAEETPPLPERDEFEAREKDLLRTLSRLEEERLEIEELQASVTEMKRLADQLEDQLQESGLYRYATDLASQIGPELASQFRPEQLVALRRLEAKISHWHEPPASFLDLLMDRFGLLGRMRLRQLDRWIAEMRLPSILSVSGGNLNDRVDSLLKLVTVYPFLLATARYQRVSRDLEDKRPLDAVLAELNDVYKQKVTYDRERLKRRWHQVIRTAQSRKEPLQTLLLLFEKIVNGDASSETWRTWWQRYDELLSVFPVICSTNLSLAGTAPLRREVFDLIIIDEASQSDIASFLPALYRGRRACVVGDDKQLRHISQLESELDSELSKAAHIRPEERLCYCRDSAFDRAKAVAGDSAYTLLDRHYRCVKEIIDFCNQTFYEGRLKVAREKGPDKSATDSGLPLQGFLVESVEGKTQYQIAAAHKRILNPTEATRVIDLIRHYAAANVTDIGVVTPFRAQRELLERLRDQAASRESNAQIQAVLRNVEIGTIHTFQGGEHDVMLFSTVVAPGARPKTIQWFEENKNLINVAISRARNLLIIVCHRPTLESAGGILSAMVRYADGLKESHGKLPPLPPGLRPERLGLPSSEAQILQEWLNPPGSLAEVLNGGEQVLYQKLQGKVADRPIMLAPKMRVLDVLGQHTARLTPRELDYAFRAHFDVVLVNLDTFLPVAAVELDGRRHREDPRTQTRDRLKDSLCEKIQLPLIWVR